MQDLYHQQYGLMGFGVKGLGFKRRFLFKKVQGIRFRGFAFEVLSLGF